MLQPSIDDYNTTDTVVKHSTEVRPEKRIIIYRVGHKTRLFVEVCDFRIC